MSRILLVILLLLSKTLTAQSFYVGGDFGAIEHDYRQNYLLGYDNYSLGLASQYFLKNNSFSIDATIYYFFYGEYSNQFHTYGSWIYINELTTADYFCFNFFNKPKNFLFQIKTGLFYSHYFTEYMIQSNDFGSAIGLGFDVKLSKKSYLCIEPTWMCGLQKFKIVSMFTVDDGIIGQGYSDITYYNFSIKYIHKI